MAKERLLISACLLGMRCRYDGNAGKRVDTEALLEKYELVPVCPEIYGGLTTPRTPSEIVGERVLMRDGTDVTENYERGADAALLLIHEFGIRKALLKARSPSCGKGVIYDGSFDGVLTQGDGITARRLLAGGVSVYTEDEIEKLL